MISILCCIALLWFCLFISYFWLFTFSFRFVLTNVKCLCELLKNLYEFIIIIVIVIIRINWLDTFDTSLPVWNGNYNMHIF